MSSVGRLCGATKEDAAGAVDDDQVGVPGLRGEPERVYVPAG